MPLHFRGSKSRSYDMVNRFHSITENAMRFQRIKPYWMIIGNPMSKGIDRMIACSKLNLEESHWMLQPEMHLSYHSGAKLGSSKKSLRSSQHNLPMMSPEKAVKA